MLIPAGPKADPAQPTIDQTISTLSHNSEKGKKITRSVASFTANDLRPYSVVENPVFCHMLKMLDPRYKLPAFSHFTEKVIPELYHETKAQVMALMTQANRVVITCDFWTSVTIHNGTLC